MTVGQWLEIVIGFVVPTAAVLWGVWILWLWFRPGSIRRPAGWLAGVIGFVLTCVLVILIILGWELFKSWRRPQVRGSASARPSATEPHGGCAVDALPLEMSTGARRTQGGRADV